MILPDVNILVHAHKEQSPRHAEMKEWLSSLLAGDAAYAMSELVVSAFVRVVTHPRIFDPPSTGDEALSFAAEVLGQPHCVRISPGARHWSIFVSLVRQSRAKGNLVADAYLAAMAIESGCEWVTIDRDYARFEGLRWRHP